MKKNEIKLNRNHVYSLKDLTSEEYEKLFNWLLGNDSGWRTVHFESWKNDNIGFNLKHNGSNWSMQEVKPTHNAKELFYTLENIQVDCRELEQKEISLIGNIYKSKGYTISDRHNKITNDCYYISFNKGLSIYGFYESDNDCYEITYSKFMELFAPQQEVTDKPKHYSKGIDTFARMEANCTKEECLAFAKGNIDKYNWRNKGQDLEDYKKIVSYANWAIKLLKDEK